MDDGGFTRDLDSDSDREEFQSSLVDSQDSQSQDEADTSRVTLQEMDERIDSEGSEDCRSVEDMEDEAMEGPSRVSAAGMNEEEEMEYMSGNDDSEYVANASAAAEESLYYSCHEEFNGESGLMESDASRRAGPRSPEGPPPESPGTADSTSETAEFDFESQTEEEVMQRLPSKMVEGEGEEDVDEHLATPVSPESSEYDEETGDTEEKGASSLPESTTRESPSYAEQTDQRESLFVGASSELTDDGENLSNLHVPDCRQDDSLVGEIRTDQPTNLGRDPASEEVDDTDQGAYIAEQENEDRLSRDSAENVGTISEDNEDARSTDTPVVCTDADRTIGRQDKNDGTEAVVVQSSPSKDNEDEDFLDLSVPPAEHLSDKKPVAGRDRAEAAVVEVHHIEDHGDELDFEEDVEDHGHAEQEAAERHSEEAQKASETEEKEKEDVIKEEADEGGDGEVKDDEDDEEGEDGELDDDDMEEGEVKDPNEKKRPETRPICRFYTRGHCTWGGSCRFIHPGVNDKGNYSLIDRRELHNAQAKLLGQPLEPPSPPPQERQLPLPEEEELEFLPPPPEEAPRVESAWERGLRHARELRKKAMQLKEKGVLPEEQKTIGDMIDEENDFDKENEFFPRKGEPDDIYLQDDMYPPEPMMYPYPMPDPYDRHYGFREPQPSPPRQVYRVRQDFNDPRRRMMDQRPRGGDRRPNDFSRARQQQQQQLQQQQFSRQRQPPQQQPFRRGRSPGGFPEKRRGREPVRNQPRREKPMMADSGPPQQAAVKSSKNKPADSWQDPWARTKSPARKGKAGAGAGRRPRSRSNSSASYSDRSYSSRSRSGSGSRSRSRSYSSRSRSSSRSSYSHSSRSRSRSKSAGSRSFSSSSSQSRSRSPPATRPKVGPARPGTKPVPKPIPRGSFKQGPTQPPKGQPPPQARAQARGPPRPQPRPQARPQQHPHQRPQQHRPSERSPPPRGQARQEPHPQTRPPVRKQGPMAAGPAKSGPPKPVDKQPPAKAKPGFPKVPPGKRRTRSRTRSESLSSISSRSSYSSYSRSRSRSHSRSRSRSSSFSRSRSRSRSIHRSFSRSRSRSRSSSVSSRSSVSSADSENMYANLASPVSSASSTDLAPTSRKGLKGPGRSSNTVSSSSRPGGPSKAGHRPSSHVVHSSSKKMGKPPPRSPTARVPPEKGPVRGPPKVPSGDRPTSSSGAKVQPQHRPSSTTAPQPKTKPSRGSEAKPGPRPTDPKMKERLGPMPSSNVARHSTSHPARKDIKLNLISKPSDEGKKRSSEPPRQEKKSRVAPVRDHKVGSSTIKQQATSSSDIKYGSSKVSSSDRKRPASPTQSKSQPSSKVAKSAGPPAGSKAAPPKKESLSRREEILKQLQAVEDLIRKKKAKMK
ncbi:uncharacterized protein [Diadema setosum]|uniref:uncharacterized protein isoform X3 n=1 Tax=Diadema setosum TaxID=31175 RepID=UPI003B3BA5FD